MLFAFSEVNVKYPDSEISFEYQQPDTTLRFPIKKDTGLDPLREDNSLYLNDPSNITTTIEYDPISNQYVLKRKIGNIDYRDPYYFDFEEYRDFEMKRGVNEYWKERSATAGGDARDGLIPTINIRSEAFDRLFGSNTIDIRPQGAIELKFGVLHNFRDDTNLDIRQRRNTSFDFDMNMQISLMAQIGEKIKLNFNIDTRNSVNVTVDNDNKIGYEGTEDEIIRSIEAGNVSMPINSRLITGSQSLFGVKTKLQFGRLSVTGIIAQQNSSTSSVTVEGGSQNTDFKIKASDYDENRHFFLSQYFRDNYENGLSTLPIISSNVNITRVEVWVTNIGSAVTENRNIVAFSDLGEYEPSNQFIYPVAGKRMPDNSSNTLMTMLDTAKVRDVNSVYNYLSTLPGADFSQGRDFEKIESARKLTDTEYTFNRSLGFISLSTALTAGQVLAVAFQYTVNDEIYQVGEFSDQGITNPNAIIIKLLRSTSIDTRHPMWNLMMKNVYSLNAYQVESENFMLNILFTGNDNGVATGYFKTGPDNIRGVSLLKLFGLDSLDAQLNPIEGGDGLFDFIDGAATSGGTINSSNGRVYFPVLEPFGSYLRTILPTDMANKYAFDSLYTQTKTNAKQLTEKDKFLLSGYYSSSGGAEINLNAFDIPQGSVVVTAGGRTLVENVDYTVDYVFGRVTILNEGILNSGTTINVSTESTSSTGIQKQSLLGLRADYLFSQHLNFGATLMHLREKPLTQKVSYGDEPIANTIWGLDIVYQKEAPFITKLIDALPLISTRAPSMISADAEFAQFIPGHPNIIGANGNSYIDDFESSKQTINLTTPGSWFLASTPYHFPEANSGNLSYGFRRSKLAWYVIDPILYQSSYMPPNIDLREVSNHYVRRVDYNELFPKAEIPNNQTYSISVLNLAYYPSERGPYNYNVDELKEDGTLENPKDKWGGIMRRMETTDFEANNIEYIEFWLLDPFMDPDDDGPLEPYNTKGGKLVFNLGDISEDILKDGRKSYENGLPINDIITGVDTTIWGRVPNLQALVYAFDNDPASRPYQDVGYDGLNSTREGNNDEYSFFYDSYISKIAEKFGGINNIAYQNAAIDPSADDFQYFRGTNLDNDDNYKSILMRYKNYNGPEGNSCAQELSPEPYDISATNNPNIEDINNDNTLSESENFYEYIISLTPDQMILGENYITDVYEAKNIQLQNGTRSNATWYQFKIPISQPDMVHGVISDFTSIRFMRVYLTEFEEQVVLRFGSLELVKGDWRRFSGDLLAPGEYIPHNSVNQTNFDVFTVSLEENGGATERVPYVIPSGIQRERDYSTTNQAQQNEQSMAITVTNLFDGDARAAYKTSGFDFRNYKNLEMFIHAHAETEADNSKYANTAGAITAFIRFGNDLTENYYEYEVPLTITPWGTTSTNVDAIWLEENTMSIEFEKLIEVKDHRKDAMKNDPTISTIYPYSEYDGKNIITILGTPSMSTVNAIMIGVRNPKQTTGSTTDDGAPISMTVWFNELRLTNFNERSAWAVTASLSANLADLGNVSVSGLYSTPGFGNIGTSISERSKETVANIYTSVNLELGKFLPESSGVKIPMHFDYSQEVSTPEYDPLDPDVYLKNQLQDMSREEKQEYKNKTQDITTKTNVNFMNVRKDRTSGSTKKPHFWDIENFDISYSYSKTKQSDIDIEYYDKTIHTGGLGYTFNANPKNVKPFSKVKFLRNKNLALIRDFNFYYQPRSFVFRTNMDKTYIERLIRNKTGDDIIINPTVSKQWNWTRNYVFKHDFATSLKFEYAANAVAYIDEPSGIIVDKEAYRQEVWNSVKSFGRINSFNQTAGLNWTVPINKIPFLNWINITARYDATLRWNASALSVQEIMGNTIENSANFNATSSLRLSTLYGYIPYVKNVVKTTARRPQTTKPKPASATDTIPQTKPKVNYGKIIGDGVIKIIFGLKDINISYQQTGGTILPGYTPEPNNFGYTWNKKAPGFGFILGSQKDIRQKAGANGWLTIDTLMNNRYSQSKATNINVRANYEPFSGFKIELTASYRTTESFSELYKADAWGNFGESGYAPSYGGSYQVSYIFIKSAFAKATTTNLGDGTQKNESVTFETLKEYRNIIAFRYANENKNYNDRTYFDTIAGGVYPVGYGPTQQEVVMTALLAAYAGIDPNKIALTTFPNIPLPNWNIQFNGLSKLEIFKPYFKNISLKHTYRSTYNVGSYTNNIYYEETSGFPSAFDDASNYIALREITSVQITEQFSPLIGIEVTMQNSLMINVQINKTRTLGMSFANNQLTDNSSDAYVFGVGYRFKDVKFTVRSFGGRGKKTNINSDINIKLDFSIRNNITVLRRIDEQVNQISSGQKIYSINFSADYMVSKNLTIALYHEQTINRPHLVTSIANSTFRSGISLRMSLAQ
jgi:cell surface protein SprA